MNVENQRDMYFFACMFTKRKGTLFVKEDATKNMKSLANQNLDLLCILDEQPFINQRNLSADSGYSLGAVNKSLKKMQELDLVDAHMQLTAKARDLFQAGKPRNAILLAAGSGLRMVPINHSAPKALLEVKGERLIERLIRQRHEVGCSDITVVVGFMKEAFEYLIDEFGVKLVVNKEYSEKNNLHSLARVAARIENTYIIPCDIWCAHNPFSKHELYSWYMVTDQQSSKATVRVNRKKELVRVNEQGVGNEMIGIAYLLASEAATVRERLAKMDEDQKYDDDFWEETLYIKERMILQAKVVPANEVVEINTYEQLRELDRDSSHLRSDAIETIAKALRIPTREIVDICVLKKGMTNRSFLFSANGTKYIMRIPGEGTDRLIDRRNEAAVYHAINGLGLCDAPVYIDPDSGYKITRFLDGVRVCDAENENDVERCMEKLRAFHALHLSVPHTFDIFQQIAFYESLREGEASVYKDYQLTKEKVFSLREYVEKVEKEWCLTHIDAVPDNFLFYHTQNGEALQLTDWEYAGMQDPHVDVAMFCIYSLYDKYKCDRLIDLYFQGACEPPVRAKIYCYISMCGLLWSNWCEYKSRMGVEFGEYSLRQYRYAKEFFQHAKELIESEVKM